MASPRSFHFRSKLADSGCVTSAGLRKQTTFSRDETMICLSQKLNNCPTQAFTHFSYCVSRHPQLFQHPSLYAVLAMAGEKGLGFTPPPVLAVIKTKFIYTIPFLPRSDFGKGSSQSAAPGQNHAAGDTAQGRASSRSASRTSSDLKSF